jgi:hypothetical protein
MMDAASAFVVGARVKCVSKFNKSYRAKGVITGLTTKKYSGVPIPAASVRWDGGTESIVGLGALTPYVPFKEAWEAAVRATGMAHAELVSCMNSTIVMCPCLPCLQPPRL